MVQSLFTSGPVDPLVVDNIPRFLGPILNVTIGAGEAISVVFSAGLGSASLLGAGGLTLGIAYAVDGGLPVMVGPISGLSVTIGERNVFTMNGLIQGLPPGTYTVGMAYQTIDPQWTNNTEATMTVMVVATPPIP